MSSTLSEVGICPRVHGGVTYEGFGSAPEENPVHPTNLLAIVYYSVGTPNR